MKDTEATNNQCNQEWETGSIESSDVPGFARIASPGGLEGLEGLEHCEGRQVGRTSNTPELRELGGYIYIYIYIYLHIYKEYFVYFICFG